jgi:hypothetical protein
VTPLVDLSCYNPEDHVESLKVNWHKIPSLKPQLKGTTSLGVATSSFTGFGNLRLGD